MPIVKITGRGLATIACAVALLWGCFIGERVTARRAYRRARQNHERPAPATKEAATAGFRSVCLTTGIRSDPPPDKVLCLAGVVQLQRWRKSSLYSLCDARRRLRSKFLQSTRRTVSGVRLHDPGLLPLPPPPVWGCTNTTSRNWTICWTISVPPAWTSSAGSTTIFKNSCWRSPAEKLAPEDAADLTILRDQCSLALLDLDEIHSHLHNPTLYVEALGNALFNPSCWNTRLSAIASGTSSPVWGRYHSIWTRPRATWRPRRGSGRRSRSRRTKATSNWWTKRSARPYPAT